MNKIWYKKAAENWNEAIPVGNGRLGAMVYSRTGHEIIQLNEESVWSRTYTDRNNESAAVSLKEIREMLNLGRVQEAQELVFETLQDFRRHRLLMKAPENCTLTFTTVNTAVLQVPALNAKMFLTTVQFTDAN